MEPAKVLQKYSVQLLSLPLWQPQFIALLNNQGLLPGDTQATIQSHRTEANAAQYFVNQINTSLPISRINFDKLLFVMKQYGGAMLILAQQMEKDLKEPPPHQSSAPSELIGM